MDHVTGADRDQPPRGADHEPADAVHLQGLPGHCRAAGHQRGATASSAAASSAATTTGDEDLSAAAAEHHATGDEHDPDADAEPAKDYPLPEDAALLDAYARMVLGRRFDGVIEVCGLAVDERIRVEPLGRVVLEPAGAEDAGVLAMGDPLAIGVPSGDLELPEADAVVVALKSRSIAPDDAVAMALPAHAWLKALNDVRLALGVRLEVTEEFEQQWGRLRADDPQWAAYEVYAWLGAVQESLVQALA